MTLAAVSARGTARGVPALPAADQCPGFNSIDTCSYVNGRIADHWSETADLLEQLGSAVP